MRRLLLGLAVAAAVLGACELAARSWGGAPANFPSPLPFQDMPDAPLRRVHGGIVWPWPHDRVAVTPAAGIRLHLYGESAAEGDGYAPFVGMGGVLERALRRALPEPVEVLNLATPGAGSRQILDQLRQAVTTERPDAVVLYVGNNELHELRALKTVMPNYAASNELLRRRLWRSHLYRYAVSRLVAPPEPFVVDTKKWPTIDRLETPADADDRALAMHFYEQNLSAMLDAAESASVPVVLATVAVNEWDLLQGDLDPERRALRDEARALERTDPVRAAEAWRRAESLDPRPMAALPETWEVVRRLAASRGATLCDVVDALGEGTPIGLPPSAHFHDHCHPTAEGHVAIGNRLAACALRALGREESAGNGAPPAAPAGRLDGFVGRRGTRLEDDGSAAARLALGNLAFVGRDLQGAARSWAMAEERGADVGVLALNRGLLALYQRDLAGARASFAEAAARMPEDPDVAEIAAAVGR